MATQAWAAPHPATTTSALTAPESGNYFNDKGFVLQTAQTGWIPLQKNTNRLSDTIHFGPNQNGSAKLSVHQDHVAASMTLESYAKKFLKDYPNYGFEVLGNKSIRINNANGLVVDMIQKNKNKQLRQVVLKQDEKVVVLTCTDNISNFNSTINSCNQIIKTFQWK